MPSTNEIELLTAALRSLRATGDNGFEGLVRALLSHYTGIPFSRARSGSQGGHDLAARVRGELIVKVECKRFAENSDLSDRSLSGEVMQAQDADPELDAWILVASRPILAQTRRELERHAAKLGVLSLFLDCDSVALGALPALCAMFPRVTAEFVEPANRPSVEGALKAIGHHARFADVSTQLSQDLRKETFGAAGVRSSLRESFAAAVRTDAASRMTFGHRVLPCGSDALDVSRSGFHASLLSWWEGWREQASSLVVHGEEGTGKTWTLASELERFILDRPDAPILVWVQSQLFDFRPIDDLVAKALHSAFSSFSTDFWLRRVRSWTGAKETTPRVLVVVDGVNEVGSRPRWEQWLSDAQSKMSRSLPSIGLVLTLRTTSWREIAPSLLDRPQEEENGTAAQESPRGRFAPLEIGDYTDDELAEASRLAKITDLPRSPELAQLLRRPRMLALAARHQERLRTAGEVTRARLFFEDWRSREEGRVGRLLTDDEFRDLLIRSAGRLHRPGDRPGLSKPELAELLKGLGDLEPLLQELVTGGIFEQVAGPGQLFRLVPDRLYLGLGLSLVERAATAAAGDSTKALDLIESELEAAGDADEVADIARYAACVALASGGAFSISDGARLAVLSGLLHLRNGGSAWERARAWSYFPAHPAVFQELAEFDWARRRPDHRALERLGFCFAWIAEKWPDDQALAAIVRRWLGFIHPNGFWPRSDGRGLEDGPPTFVKDLELLRQASPETSLVEVSETELLHIARLALLVVSIAQKPHLVEALATWALSRNLMAHDFEFSAVAWIVRLAGPQARQILLDRAERWAGTEFPALRKAAATLYRLSGSESASARAGALQPQVEPAWNRPWRSVAEANVQIEAENLDQAQAAARLGPLVFDPNADLGGLNRWRGETALASIPMERVGRSNVRTTEDSHLERVEPALCRTSPGQLAEYYRRLVRGQIDEFAAGSVRRVHHLADAFLVLSSHDLRHVRKLLATKIGDANVAKAQEHERDWELPGVVLASLRSPVAQLHFLLSLGDGKQESRDWEPLLGPLPERAVRKILARLPRASATQARRSLWFRWKEAYSLSESDRQVLEAAANLEDVGLISLHLAVHARDPQLLATLVKAGHYDDESASLIAARYLWARRALAAIQNWLTPGEWLATRSWTLLEAGRDSRDVELWVSSLDQSLRNAPGHAILTGSGIASAATLREAARVAPQIVSRWLEAILERNKLGLQITEVRHWLLTALVSSLLESNDPRASRVFATTCDRRQSIVTFTDSESGLPSLWFAPFRVPETEQARVAAMGLLEGAMNNDQLQQVAYAAARYGKSGWLRRIVEEEWRSTPEMAKARAMGVVALGPSSAQAEAWISELEIEDTWLRDVRRWALSSQSIDARARHWFREFMHLPSRESAWASFKLFLACADRRYLLWVNDEIAAAPLAEKEIEQRRRHLILNQRRLHRRVEEAATEQRKRLFSWSLPDIDLAPWKTAWKL